MIQFPESGVLNLLFKTPSELQTILKEIERPFRIINIYGVSPSRHYVALEKITDENLEIKKKKNNGG